MTPKDLRKRREAAGLSQGQLGKLVGLSRFSVGRDEKGPDPIAQDHIILYETVLQNVTQGGKGKPVLTEEPVKINGDLNPAVLISAAATSSASLTLICEILAAVTDEPLEKVRARATELTVVRSRNFEVFLKTLI